MEITKDECALKARIACGRRGDFLFPGFCKVRSGKNDTNRIKDGEE
jgi:hypothetical protein